MASCDVRWSMMPSLLTSVGSFSAHRHFTRFTPRAGNLAEELGEYWPTLLRVPLTLIKDDGRSKVAYLRQLGGLEVRWIACKVIGRRVGHDTHRPSRQQPAPPMAPKGRCSASIRREVSKQEVSGRRLLRSCLRTWRHFRASRGIPNCAWSRRYFVVLNATAEIPRGRAQPLAAASRRENLAPCCQCARTDNPSPLLCSVLSSARCSGASKRDSTNACHDDRNTN